MRGAKLLNLKPREVMSARLVEFFLAMLTLCVPILPGWIEAVAALCYRVAKLNFGEDRD